MPVPNAVIIVRISSFERILSSRAFSTLSIFPFMGNIAWYRLSLPCRAEPPAESPSTMYNSHRSGFFSEQSASFPGREPESKAPFRLVSSRAFLAASLALAASIALSTILFPTEGVSSKKVPRPSLVTASTIPSTSEFPSLDFVCPSNCGFGTFMLITQVMPSLASSPERDAPLSLSRFLLLQYWLIVLVRADLNPLRWVPPSMVLMLLTNVKIVSP